MEHNENKQSIDTPEFRELLAQLLDAAETAKKANDPMLYKPVRDNFVAHIHAWRDDQLSGARAAVSGELAQKANTLLKMVQNHQYGLRGFGDGSLSRGRDLTRDELGTIEAALKLAAQPAAPTQAAPRELVARINAALGEAFRDDQVAACRAQSAIQPFLPVIAAAAPSVSEQDERAPYRWQSVDGKQHDTGRVTTAKGNYFATTGSPDDAKLVAEALNARAVLTQGAQAAQDDEQSEAWKNGYSSGFEAAKQVFGAQAAQGGGVQVEATPEMIEAVRREWHNPKATYKSVAAAVLTAHPAPSAAPDCAHMRTTTTALGAATNSGWKCADCGKLLSKQDAPDRAAPSQVAQTNDSAAEFLSQRLARVARAVGYKMPEGSHEFIAGVAGTILGDIARKLEAGVCTQNDDAHADGIHDPFYCKAHEKQWYKGGSCTATLTLAAPVAPSQQEGVPSQAGRDVLAERKRQVSAEGWTPEHDDEHGNGAMAEAAACYITGRIEWSASDQHQRWPWAREWWKPKTRRGNLVRAAALLIAEIERIDRAAHQASAQEAICPHTNDYLAPDGVRCCSACGTQISAHAGEGSGNG